MVVRSDLGEETQRAFINLFKYAQQFYGQKVSLDESSTNPLANIKKRPFRASNIDFDL